MKAAVLQPFQLLVSLCCVFLCHSASAGEITFSLSDLAPGEEIALQVPDLQLDGEVTPLHNGSIKITNPGMIIDGETWRLDAIDTHSSSASIRNDKIRGSAHGFCFLLGKELVSILAPVVSEYSAKKIVSLDRQGEPIQFDFFRSPDSVNLVCK